MNRDFTELYCFVDDFLSFFDKNFPVINSCNGKRGPACSLSRSEILTIILGYPSSGFDCFKNYYKQEIMNHHEQDFRLVSYKRFNKLIKGHLKFLIVMLYSIFEECDGLSLVDSTSIAVCKNYRIRSHKVFDGLASRGKTTKGWFFGLKLHIMTNLKGSLIKACFSSGNVDDRKVFRSMVKNIFGKVFGDRGYISKELFEELFGKDIQLITRLKKNMKNILMPIYDKIISTKRILIESVIGRIKLLGKFEHSRHRSVTNAFVHMIACLINYQLLDDKPSIASLIHIDCMNQAK